MDAQKFITRLAKAQSSTQIAEILNEVSLQADKELAPIAGQIQILQAQKEGIIATKGVIEKFAETKRQTLGSDITESED